MIVFPRVLYTTIHEILTDISIITWEFKTTNHRRDFTVLKRATNHLL